MLLARSAWTSTERPYKAPGTPGADHASILLLAAAGLVALIDGARRLFGRRVDSHDRTGP